MVINSEQQRVIDELDRNILLLASAGTGKTNTLAYRVAHIIESGRCEAHQILCMTFTNKAAQEMKSRIESLVGQPAKAVEISTFHSFCFYVLQQEGKRDESLYTDVTIFDEEDCKELYLPYKPRNMRDMNFASLISMVKEYRSVYEFYSESLIDDYKRTIQRLEQDQSKQIEKLFYNYNTLATEDLSDFWAHGHEWIARYDESLQSVHGVDFTDLICGVHRLFQNPDIRERWRSRYQYISVDEMQDTGSLEYKVMEMLWEGNHVLLCGDYFQTIYEWRGSDPFRLLEAFTRDFNPLKIIFYKNYRANRTLFTMAFKTLQTMFPQLVGDVYDEMPEANSASDGAPILVKGCRNEYMESKFIYDRICALPKDASIGVLVRDNRKAQRLSEQFERYNQDKPESERRPFMIIDEYKFFRRQEIKDIMAYFKLLMNPNDAVSAKRIIKRYVSGIGDARIRDIESPKNRSVGLKLTDFMDMPIFESEPYAKLVAGLAAGDVVVYDVESTGTDTIEDRIIQIAAMRIDKDGNEIERFERFINPGKSVGTSQLVHGFTDEYLAEHGESPNVVLEAFKEFSHNRIIVGHNVNYDISILSHELARHNLGEPHFKAVYDTLDIFRRFYPTLENHKLGFLSNHFPINHTPTHNAMDDIIATGQLLIYAVRENIVPTTTDRMVAINQYKAAFTTIASQMATLRRKMHADNPTELLAYIMNQMGVLEYYKSHGEMTKVEHIRDLYRIMESLDKEYEGMTGLARLNHILQLAALTAGEPQQMSKQSKIPIITIHQAKGSEFDHVFLAGMNQGTFPSFISLREGNEDEEKRLFYVAITRPKQELIITYTNESQRGQGTAPSAFLDYMPKDSKLVERSM